MRMKRIAFSDQMMLVMIYVFLVLLTLSTLYPFWNALVVSFNAGLDTAKGGVTVWPRVFTLENYKTVMNDSKLLNAFMISIYRTVIGTISAIFCTALLAYGMTRSYLMGRKFYMLVFVFTMYFGGGLIPWYMTIKYTGIMDTIWALVLPGAVPVFNIILLLNFFRSLPKELEESASIDGASHWTTLWRIYAPLSMPAIATIMLFTIVGHWNAWFDGLILMKSHDNYPLSTYLQTILVSMDLTSITGTALNDLREVSDRTAKAAQIFVGALPIMIVYPFLQRYFVKGIVMGSVKE